jgi:hypothetical protein
VHPLAVILAIGAGVLLGGIVGALFAVPTVAVVNVVVEYLHETSDGQDPEEAGAGPGIGEREEPVPEVDSPVADRPEPTNVSTASR